MLDPGIAVEKGYEVYDSGSELDVWIQTADGKPFVGTLACCREPYCECMITSVFTLCVPFNP
jgi:hypothetical protein